MPLLGNAYNFAKGLGQGLTTDVLGAPVDLMTMAMRPFGYKTERPVGGSDWIAEKLGIAPSDDAYEQAGRAVGGLFSPGPGEVTHGAPALASLLAFHGTPHGFDKFDIRKIGTGEGAQAQGHGLYFASDPDVSEYYRKKLARGVENSAGEALPTSSPLLIAQNENSDRYVGDLIRGALSKSDSPDQAVDLLKDELKTLQRQEEAIRKYAKGAGEDIKFYEPEMRRLERSKEPLKRAIAFAEKGGLKKSEGYTYKVELNTDRSALLDWDAPLSKQHPDVRPGAEQLQDLIEFSLDDPSMIGTRELWRAIHGDPTGASLYHFGRKALSGETEDPTVFAKTGPQLSELLNSWGIPGVRYIGHGSGKENYVTFADDLINILERYNGAPARR